MVKLDLGIAKLDWYVLSNPSANTGPFSFSIDHEGVFLFLKPVQLAVLWPWVKAVPYTHLTLPTKRIV